MGALTGHEVTRNALAGQECFAERLGRSRSTVQLEGKHRCADLGNCRVDIVECCGKLHGRAVLPVYGHRLEPSSNKPSSFRGGSVRAPGRDWVSQPLACATYSRAVTVPIGIAGHWSRADLPNPLILKQLQGWHSARQIRFRHRRLATTGQKARGSVKLPDASRRVADPEVGQNDREICGLTNK